MPHRPWHTGSPFLGGGMYGEEFDLPALFAASARIGNLPPDRAANAISSAVQQISASPSSPFQDFEMFDSSAMASPAPAPAAPMPGPGMGNPYGGGGTAPMDMAPLPPGPGMGMIPGMGGGPAPMDMPAPPAERPFLGGMGGGPAPMDMPYRLPEHGPQDMDFATQQFYRWNPLTETQYGPEPPSDDVNLGTLFGRDSNIGRGIQKLGNLIPWGGPSRERQEDIANLPANIWNRDSESNVFPGLKTELESLGSSGMDSLRLLSAITGTDRDSLLHIPFDNDPTLAGRGSITEGRPTSIERTVKGKEEKRAKEQEDKYTAQQEAVEKAWQDMMEEGSETERKTKLEEMEVKIKNSTTYSNLGEPLSDHDLSIVAANVLDKDPRGIANEGTITNEINTVIAKVPGATVSPKEEVSPSGSSYRDLVPAPAAEVPSVVSPKEEVEAVKAVEAVKPLTVADQRKADAIAYAGPGVGFLGTGGPFDTLIYEDQSTKEEKDSIQKEAERKLREQKAADAAAVNEPGQNGDKFTGYTNVSPDLTTNYMTPESKSEVDDKNVWGIGTGGPTSLWQESLSPFEQWRQWRMAPYGGATLGGMARGMQSLGAGYQPAYGRFLLGSGQGGYEGNPMDTGAAFKQYLEGDRRGLGDVRSSYGALAKHLGGYGGTDWSSLSPAWSTLFDPGSENYRSNILSASQAALGMSPGFGQQGRSSLGNIYDVMQTQYGPEGAGKFSDWVSSAYT